MAIGLTTLRRGHTPTSSPVSVLDRWWILEDDERHGWGLDAQGVPLGRRHGGVAITAGRHGRRAGTAGAARRPRLLPGQRQLHPGVQARVPRRPDRLVRATASRGC